MKAALVHEVGAVPRLVEVGDPVAGEGEVVVEMTAAAINPADLAIAAGLFHGGHPPLPYAPGMEAVGLVGGRAVFAYGGGLGVSRSGTLAERFLAPASAVIDLPEGADPSVAAALGTAGLAGWLPMTYKAKVQPGEIVLVLGATGTAGTIAVQAARLAGAGKVIAAGRNAGKLERLADLVDETVALEGEEMAAKLAEACRPGADVVYDPLWGDPLASALAACAPDARIVHVGASAGQVAALPSALVRGRRISILGYSNAGVPRQVIVDAYLEMVRRSIAGELNLEVASVPLGQVEHAWAETKAGGGKYVLVGGGR
ncbi:MAG TPA: zinc-binding dehydrogenase [Acidimicrobiia bacterium]|nr:zinc-binding dehydrogenase [Acidimicrobiia bacterium]